MASDSDYRVDFDPKASLLERHNSTSDSLPLIERQNSGCLPSMSLDELAMEQQKTRSKKSNQSIGTKQKKQRWKVRMAGEESDEEPLIDDMVYDVFDDVIATTDDQNKQDMHNGHPNNFETDKAKAPKVTDNHVDVVNSPVDMERRPDKCLPDLSGTYITVCDVDEELPAKHETVLEKLALAETDIKQCLNDAEKVLKLKKKFLLKRLDVVRTKKREYDEKERSRVKKTPIQVLKTSRTNPAAIGDSEENNESVFVRKKVIRTDKRKAELRLLSEIDVIVKKAENISLDVRKFNYATPFLVAKSVTDVGDDEETPDLVDVLSMKVKDKVIILTTDFKNASLKSFSHWQGDCVSSVLRFDNSPWGVTKMDDSQVVVSIPLAYKLCLVDVSSDLKLVETIKAKKQYYGLVSIGSSVFVATSPYSSPRSVDMVDLSGAILKTLTIETLLPQPSFICGKLGGGFVVSDLSKGALLGVSNTLEVGTGFQLDEDARLQSTRGVAANQDGDIFVVDYREKKVKVFSNEGVFLKDFLTSADGLRYPYGVCFDDDNHVYVTDGGEIKIFTY